MCKGAYGTCTLPRALGSLNNYGDALSAKTLIISGQDQDDIFKFNVNKKGRVIASLTSTAGIGIDGIAGGVKVAVGAGLVGSVVTGAGVAFPSQAYIVAATAPASKNLPNLEFTAPLTIFSSLIIAISPYFIVYKSFCFIVTNKG